MIENNKIERLRSEWGKREKQINVAQRHPLGMLWMWYLSIKLEEARQRYQEEENYLRTECHKMTTGPFSGIHG